MCSCAHHGHMLVEQKLHYIAINEQLMTCSDCVTLNRLCRLTLKPKQTKMSKNTAKEKGMKIQVLDADREYFLVSANSAPTFTSTLTTICVSVR